MSTGTPSGRHTKASKSELGFLPSSSLLRVAWCALVESKVFETELLHIYPVPRLTWKLFIMPMPMAIARAAMVK